MTQRGIALDEILDVVNNGQIGTASPVPGFLNCFFFHRSTFVLVSAEYGDRNALPKIVTVFRDGEEYTPDIEDLYSERVVEKVVEKIVYRAADDLSIDELLQLVERKKSAEQEAINKEIASIDAEMKRLLDKVNDCKARRNELHAKLGASSAKILVPSVSLSNSKSQLDLALDDPVIKSDGFMNVKATAEKYSVAYDVLLAAAKVRGIPRRRGGARH